MRWAANPDVANSSRSMTTRCASLAHTVRPGKRGAGHGPPASSPWQKPRCIRPAMHPA